MEINKLVEKFNSIVAKYDDGTVPESGKVVLLNTVDGMVTRVPFVAYNDPEFKEVYNKLLEIYSMNEEKSRQEYEDKLDELIDKLGIEGIDKLINEHTIGLETETYPGFVSEPTIIRTTDDPKLMRMLLAAKNRYQAKMAKTI